MVEEGSELSGRPKSRLKTCLGAFRSRLDRVGLGVLVSIFHCLLESLLRIKDSIILVFLVIFLFAVWFLHLYKGVLTHVCIKSHENNSPEEEKFSHYINSTSWIDVHPNAFYDYCGTYYGTRKCPSGYTCMEYAGPVTSQDYTTYNTIASAFTAILVIATNDFWEWLCQTVLLAKGKWNITTFMIVILVSYCVLGTILCTVYAAFNKIWKKDEKRKAKVKAKLAAKKNLRAATPIFRSRTVSRETAYVEDGLFEEHESEPEEPQPQSTVCKRVKDVLCGWECCGCCDRFKNFFYKCVFNPIFQTIVSVCLIIDLAISVALNSQMYMEEELNLITSYMEIVFFFIYAVEAILKFAAQGPKGYFGNRWNNFEFAILLLLLLELSLMEFGGVYFFFSRFFKLFRLGRFFPSLGRMIQMSNSAFVIQFFFIILLGSFSTLMAVIGVEGFGPAFMEYQNTYNETTDSFRHWHMGEYLNSLLVIVRILTGEWVESLWECSFTGGWACVPFFLILIVIGNLALVNIFTFFLLSEVNTAIGKESEKPVTPTVKFMADGADCFIRAWNCIQNRIGCQPSRYKRTRLQSGETDSNEIRSAENVMYVGLLENEQVVFTQGSGHVKIDGPGPCFPTCCFKFLPFDLSNRLCWSNFRQICYSLSNTTCFEIATLSLITISTVCLAMEDIYLKDSGTLSEMTYTINILITVTFALEMSIRLIGRGCGDYFYSIWRLWDFIIVLASVLSCFDMLISPGGIPFLRCLRVLRLVRFLNLTWQFEPSRITANTIAEAFPGMVNVFSLGILEWIVFAVLGTSIFFSRFNTCLFEHEDGSQSTLPIAYWECESMNDTMWIENDLNFNNIFESLLTLGQVATIKSWTDVTSVVILSPDEYYRSAVFQKVNTVFSFLYFILFIIFGAYYTYVLWLSVLIDGYNRQKIKSDLVRDLKTPGDSIYYRAMKNIKSLVPNKPIIIGENKTQRNALSIVEDIGFDVTLCIVITINMILLSFPHYLQSEAFTVTLLVIDIFFIVIYATESILKILAFKMNVFDDWVNVLDIITVCLAIISVANQNIIGHYIFPPMMLRLIRLYKIIRSRKWYKPLKGLTMLIETLTRMVPYLVSVTFAYVIIIVAYAVIGMFLFKDVEHGVQEAKDFHFKTFGNALVVLCQMSVSSGWESFLRPFRNDIDRLNCSSYYDCTMEKLWPIVYIISFLITTYVTMFTLLTVLILQLYNQVKTEYKIGLFLDDFAERFYEVWKQYDPSRTEYLNFRDLANFVNMQENVLRVDNKRNAYQIAVMDIPIIEGDRVFHRDIIDALYRNALARKGWPISDILLFEDYTHPDDYEPISTTLWRKREEFSASIIQRAWRRYKRTN